MKEGYLKLIVVFCFLFINSLAADISNDQGFRWRESQLVNDGISSSLIEIKYFAEIYDYLASDTLIILDVDNTLMEPVQEFGNDQWFRWRLRQLESNGVASNEALSQALSEWHAIQAVTKSRPVELTTPALVGQLQSSDWTVIALTTRGLAVASRTLEQLESIGFCFKKSSPQQHSLLFQNETQDILFRHGVLFTNGTHKGTSFLTLLDLMDYHPKRVLFVNDKASHIKELEVACYENSIEFIGLRYGHLDERVNNFRSELAEIQGRDFWHIHSDEEAETLLH